MSTENDRPQPLNNPHESIDLRLAFKLFVGVEILFCFLVLQNYIEWIRNTFDTTAQRCDTLDASGLTTCYIGVKACWIVFILATLAVMMLVIFFAYCLAVVYIADDTSKHFWRARRRMRITVRLIVLILIIGGLTSIVTSKQHLLMSTNRTSTPVPSSITQHNS